MHFLLFSSTSIYIEVVKFIFERVAQLFIVIGLSPITLNIKLNIIPKLYVNFLNWNNKTLYDSL